MITKGILLAGGSGTRLHPMTKVVSKQLLPVYDKPMVYYPLATLMEAGIRDIMVITTPQSQSQFHDLLGSGRQWGTCIEYMCQDRPEGIAQAFILAEEWLDGDGCALALGDNILVGGTLEPEEQGEISGAAIFASQVSDPRRYGVIEFDGDEPVGIVEKPHNPKSNWAIPGLYFYDDLVSTIAKQLKPSVRGELEISDINRVYMDSGLLKVKKLDHGTAWFDAGTPDSLLQASNYVQAVQERQGGSVGCPYNTAMRKGWVL